MTSFARSYLLRLPSRTILESCEAAKLAETVPLVPLVPHHSAVERVARLVRNATSESSSESSPENPFESQWFNARHSRQVLFGLQLQKQKHRVIQTEQPQESVQTERFTGPDCSPEFLFDFQIHVPAQTWYIMGHHETSWEIMRHSHTWSQPELTERKTHNFASRWWFWSG